MTSFALPFNLNSTMLNPIGLWAYLLRERYNKFVHAIDVRKQLIGIVEWKEYNISKNSLNPVFVIIINFLFNHTGDKLPKNSTEEEIHPSRQGG